MRKLGMVLMAGMLAVALTAGFGFADGSGKTPVSVVPTMGVKALQQTAKPGELVTVELFLKNVSDVACYQLAVSATGGEQGTLTLQDIVVDTARKDYLFLNGQVIKAVDMLEGRAGALQMQGSRNVTKPVHLASAVFQVSSDAKGVFQIQPRDVGKDTFLRDSQAREIRFQAEGCTVAVGEGMTTAPPPKKVRRR